MSETRICFVTCELEGVDKNGGVGTATRYICENLANAGHHVHLYYSGERVRSFRRVQRELKACGVAAELVAGDVDTSRRYDRRPYRVYQALKNTDFDVYIFPDWQADGFFCFCAREGGVAFTQAKLGIILHSPTQWCCEANRRWIHSPEALAISEMERACVEKADFLLSPSQYLLDWVQQRGWKVPEYTQVVPYFVSPPPSEKADRGVSEPDARPAQRSVREIAFFGRFEERKGIRVFIDALQLLPKPLLSKMRITFLGSACDLNRRQVKRALGSDVRRHLAGVKIITNYDSLQARRYLINHDCLAVMPSLTDNSPCVVYECLEENIPFVISNRGGGRELVAHQDRERVTFAPDKRNLADTLHEVVADEGAHRPAQPSFTREGTMDLWNAFFAWVQNDRPSSCRHNVSAADDRPLVSIVLVHHNRGHLLQHALESLVNQDYANKEIIVVDDGSTEEEALAYLDQIETATQFPCPVVVLRQQNRYLGAARNRGFRSANGAFLVFFDDDNYALPTMVSTLVKAIVCSGADCVSCGQRLFYRQRGAPTSRDARNPVTMYWGGAPRLTGLMKNHFGDATGIYRKDILEKVGGFHEEYGVTHEDWRLYVEVQLAGGSIATVPEVLFWYRLVRNSMAKSTNAYDNFQQLLVPYRRLFPELLADAPEFIVASSRSATWRTTRTMATAILAIPVLGPLASRVKRRILRWR